MIWFVTAISILFAIVDWLVYRRRIRYKNNCIRRGFIGIVLVSYLLPILLIGIQTLLPDNSTAWMKTAQWIIFLYLLLQNCRLGYYLGLLVDHRRQFSRTGVVLALACAFMLVWGATHGRQAIVVNRVEVQSPRLPGSFDGLRIVQFSDLHIGTLINPEKEMNRLVDTINALHPDLIVFTGDLVNVRYSELTPRYREILGRLQAPYGILSVLGNHDVGRYIKDTIQLPADTSTRMLVKTQQEMGWHVLENETVYLHRGNDSISVSGIAFDRAQHIYRHRRKIPDVELTSAYLSIPEGTYNLTLAHVPQIWEEIIASGYGDLTLSGHVHSMQLRINLFGRGLSPASWLYKRWSGRYEDGLGHTLYINDGIGYVGYPMRLGAYPEVTLFILKR